MAGYFTKWTETHLPPKKEVPSVLSVPTQAKALSDKDSRGTQRQDYVKVKSVLGVPDKNKSVPLKASNTNAYSPSGTQEHKEHEKSNNILKIQYYTDFFEECAEIAEFEGCQSRTEAESVAYKDTAIEWIYNNPPTGATIYNCAYCGYEFDFSNCNLAACGDVYCCHFDDGNDHLRPYQKSRFKEAAAYLKSIGIKQLIQEI